MKALITEARTENLDQVLAFVRAALPAEQWNIKEISAVELAVEEVFANICNYAYEGKNGIICIFTEDILGPGVQIKITDQGIPYNPLEHAMPDLALKTEERPVGGLGIFFVRQLMDQVDYCRNGSENQLILVKYARLNRELAPGEEHDCGT